VRILGSEYAGVKIVGKQLMSATVNNCCEQAIA
jgi:hypothetical protein